MATKAYFHSRRTPSPFRCKIAVSFGDTSMIAADEIARSKIEPLQMAATIPRPSASGMVIAMVMRVTEVAGQQPKNPLEITQDCRTIETERFAKLGCGFRRHGLAKQFL
jgi:hypothetical protein